jgi:hypothetical protein
MTHKETRLQAAEIQQYCQRNALAYSPKKDTYSLREDQITFKCLKCNSHIFTVKILDNWRNKHINYGYNCPQCYENCHHKTPNPDVVLQTPNFNKNELKEEFRMQLADIEQYEMVEFYGVRKDGELLKASFQCLYCGTIRQMLPNNMTNKKSRHKNCPLCHNDKNYKKV